MWRACILRHVHACSLSICVCVLQSLWEKYIEDFLFMWLKRHPPNLVPFESVLNMDPWQVESIRWQKASFDAALFLLLLCFWSDKFRLFSASLAEFFTRMESSSFSNVYHFSSPEPFYKYFEVPFLDCLASQAPRCLSSKESSPCAHARPYSTSTIFLKT